jgi:methyl-accepting chemotaxis protein
MSDSQAYEAVQIASDGVTVTKRFEADEFPVPAIAFNFESRRSEPVTVRLSDVVPDDVAVEDLGFHPEYGIEYWTIDDDEISFEREIEPDGEYTTVYGIRATGTDNVEQFLTEPQFDEVDPPLEDDEGAIVGDGSDAVKDVISGDADSVPGLDDVDDDDIETLDLKDPNNEGTPQSAESGDDDSGSAAEAADEDETAEATDVELSGDSLVAALANELRNQNVTKDDVQLLRKAFDLASDNDGSVKARVQKLQQDVTDVIAYTDALEEFLDENGTGDEIVDEFRTEVSEFREQVESFDSELDEVQSTAQANEEQVTTLSSDVEVVEGTVDDVEGAVDDVEGTVDDLETRMEELTEELESVRDEMGDGDVDEKIEEIHSEIEELKEWREQLSSVIGGGN